MTTITLTVNGRPVTATVEPRTHLADFLREDQDLTGTHLGCEHGVCGACTLLVDGVPVRSCITYAVACAGADVVTIEGLDDDEVAAELRAAFSREHALQCGYCTPGMLISARDLVLRAVSPSERDIRVAMSGNLCRCTGYVGIVRAVTSVIASRRGRGVAAIAGAGRARLGPAGAGHAAATPASERSAIAPVQSAALTTSTAAFVPQITMEQAFVVAHSPADVWAFFSRIGDVATCLPGASITEMPNDREVIGKIRLKVGPIVAEFHGRAEIERDPANFSGTIRGAGQDARSSSATRGVIEYRLLPGPDRNSTQVNVRIGYTLTGPLAQFSRGGLVQEIANNLTKTFARNLEAKLSGSDAHAAELNAAALLMSAFRARIAAWWRTLRGT